MIADKLEGEEHAPRALLIGGSAALAMAMGIGRFAATPILPAMEAATHLDTTQAGLLASANYAGYLIGALAASATTPATRGRLLICSLLTIVVTTAVMASTTSLILWGVIRFVSGVASAGVFVLASSIVLATLRRQQRVGLSGWLYSGVGVGIALSGVVVRIAGSPLGWRGDWLLLAILAAAAAVPAWRWLLREHGGATPGTTSKPLAVRGLRVALALLLTAYVLEGTGYIVTGTFLVSIVERMRGLAGFGSSVWIVVGLSAVPSAILWTKLAGRLGYPRALALAYVAQACGIGLPLLGNAWAVLLSAILFGGTFIGISALTLTLVGQLAPGRSARNIGIFTAAFGLGQIAGPILAAALAGQTHNFTLALLLAAALVLLASLCTAAVQRFSSSVI